MSIFVLHCLDKADHLALRVATRDEHLAYWASTKVAKLGGPYLNPQGQPMGSLIFVEAENEAAAEALSQADPYRKAGLFQTVEVRGWRHAVGQLP